MKFCLLKGTFINDKKDGKCVYIYKSGDTYEGEFINDLFALTGTIKFNNGLTYDY